MSGYNNSMILQEAMKKAEAEGSDDCPVRIKLVAPPLYVLTTQTLDKVCLCCWGCPFYKGGKGLRYIGVYTVTLP